MICWTSWQAGGHGQHTCSLGSNKHTECFAEAPGDSSTKQQVPGTKLSARRDSAADRSAVQTGVGSPCGAEQRDEGTKMSWGWAEECSQLGRGACRGWRRQKPGAHPGSFGSSTQLLSALSLPARPLFAPSLMQTQVDPSQGRGGRCDSTSTS